MRSTRRLVAGFAALIMATAVVLALTVDTGSPHRYASQIPGYDANRGPVAGSWVGRSHPGPGQLCGWTSVRPRRPGWEAAARAPAKSSRLKDSATRKGYSPAAVALTN